MGYNVTPRGDGGFHVEPDGSGCGCMSMLFFIGLGLFLMFGGAFMGEKANEYLIAGIICIVVGIILKRKLGD